MQAFNLKLLSHMGQSTMIKSKSHIFNEKLIYLELKNNYFLYTQFEDFFYEKERFSTK